MSHYKARTIVIRHILVTTLIVAGVTGAVAWINQDLIAATQRTGWADFDWASNVQEPVQTVSFSADEASNDEASRDEASQDEEEQALKDVNLFGHTTAISLFDENRLEDELAGIWKVFEEDEYLHMQANAGYGDVSAFALYYDLDFNRGVGKVLVGYDLGSRLEPEDSYVSLRVYGQGARYFEMQNGLAPDSAWEAAYPEGWVLERHDLDAYGALIGGDAWVGSGSLRPKQPNTQSGL